MRTTLEQVGIRALKARLSELVHRAADGETIVVTENGRPVAKLVAHRSMELAGRLAELVRRGQVTLATTPGNIPRVGGKMRPGSSLSDLVVEARRNDRPFR